LAIPVTIVCAVCLKSELKVPQSQPTAAWAGVDLKKKKLKPKKDAKTQGQSLDMLSPYQKKKNLKELGWLAASQAIKAF
jgi:hypothetical protein